MTNDQQPLDPKASANPQAPAQPQASKPTQEEIDGLKNKKPEELTPEELRLMADTMPGEGPGD